MSKGFWITYLQGGKVVTRNTWQKDATKWPKGATPILAPGCGIARVSLPTG